MRTCEVCGRGVPLAEATGRQRCAKLRCARCRAAGSAGNECAGSQTCQPSPNGVLPGVGEETQMRGKTGDGTPHIR
jgi:hypothetical protein